MQTILIGLGVVLSIVGLAFAYMGVGSEGGGAKGLGGEIQAPAWLLLVICGVGLVLFAATRSWDDGGSSAAATVDPPATVATATAVPVTENPTTEAPTTDVPATETRPTATTQRDEQPSGSDVTPVPETTGVGPATTTGCQPTLERGCYEPAVAELQAELNRAGFNAGDEDGSFGRQTEAALRLFESTTDGAMLDGTITRGRDEWSLLQNAESGSADLAVAENESPCGRTVVMLCRAPIVLELERHLADAGALARGEEQNQFFGPVGWEALVLAEQCLELRVDGAIDIDGTEWAALEGFVADGHSVHERCPA